jgi:hypothetical protein
VPEDDLDESQEPTLSAAKGVPLQLAPGGVREVREQPLWGRWDLTLAGTGIPAVAILAYVLTRPFTRALENETGLSSGCEKLVRSTLGTLHSLTLIQRSTAFIPTRASRTSCGALASHHELSGPVVTAPTCIGRF